MTKSMILFATPLLALLAAACGPEDNATAETGDNSSLETATVTPTPSPTPSPTPTPTPTAASLNLSGKVLVVEGDDISVGPDSYASLYAKENPALAVHNLATNGATMADLMARRDQALALKPDVLTISIGLNELCQTNTYSQSLNEYIQPFHEIGTKVVVATPLPRDSAAHDTCDKKHKLMRPVVQTSLFMQTYYDFDATLNFGGDKVMGDDAAVTDTALYKNGLIPTAEGQKRLLKIYDRVLGGVWASILGVPAPVAPKDDGALVIVAEGSSSSVSYAPYFNGLYRDTSKDVDDWYGSSIGGSTVDTLATRLPKVLMLNPDVVSVYIGSNDLGKYKTVEEFTDKLKAYAQPLRAAGIKVLVFTLPNRISTATNFDANHNVLRKQLAGVFDRADWVDGYADFAAHPIMGADNAPLDTNLFRDGLHATEYGHSLYFETYKPALDKVVAMSAPPRK